VEDLFFAVVGLVVVNRRLNFNVFKKTAAVPSLAIEAAVRNEQAVSQGLCLFY
jgi:hypothetical protein